MIYRNCGNGYYRRVPAFENLSFLEWYRKLREYQHWSVLASIWYAIWLSM